MASANSRIFAGLPMGGMYPGRGFGLFAVALLFSCASNHGPAPSLGDGGWPTSGAPATFAGSAGQVGGSGGRGDAGADSEAGAGGEAGSALSNGDQEVADCALAPDGARCDDQDPCTADDTCQSGTCQGAAFESSAQVLGQLTAFGHGLANPQNSSSEPSGVATLLSEARLVFADDAGAGVQLSLVDVGANGLEQRSALESPLSWGLTAFSGWAFSVQPSVLLAPLSNDRFVAASGGILELYEAHDNQLRLLSRNSRNSFLSVIGHGDHFWSCTRGSVQNFHVDASGTIVNDGSSSDLGALCLSLALSPDGATLYAAGLFGLIEFDIAAGTGQAVFRRQPQNAPLFAVQAFGDRVAVQRIQNSSTIGDIIVYSSSDLATPLVTFPKAAAEGTPLGFALLGDGIVVARALGTTSSFAIMAEYYVLAGGQAVLKSRLDISRLFPSQATFQDGIRFTAAGSNVVVQPTRRVLHVSAAGELSELTGAQQGHFATVSRVGRDQVLSGDSDSSHRIDLSDPAFPRLLAGGLLPAQVEPLQLQLPQASGGTPALGAYRGLSGAEGRISLMSLAAGAGLKEAGKVRISDGPALLSQFGSSLYALSATLNTPIRITEYSLAPLQANPGGVQDLTLVRKHALELPRHDTFVDSSNGDVYAIEPGDAQHSLILHRYTRDATSELGVRDTLAVPGTNGSGSAAAGSVVLVVEQHTAFLISAAKQLAVTGTFQGEARSDLIGIVHLGPKEVELATRDETTQQAGMLVLRTPDLKPIIHYDLDEAPLSLTSVGKSLAVAAGNRLIVLSPQCPLEEPARDCPSPDARSCLDPRTVQACAATTGNWQPLQSCVDTCVDGKCLTANAVHVGQRHVCAVLSDQTVRCWGQGDLLGAHVPIDQASAGPVSVLSEDGSSLLTAQTLAVGSLHSCALTPTGTVQCWGYSLYGELGNHQPGGTVPVAEAHAALDDSLAPLAHVVQLAAGGHTTCALLDDSTVKCFGWGAHGQLGNNQLGATANRTVASPVLDAAAPDQPLRSVTQLSVGYLHACALLQDGTVRCWGNNELGQLGDGGSELRSALPRGVLAVDGAGLLSGIVQLSAGYSHTCAVRADGSAYCWGEGRYGELGQTPSSGATFSALPLAVQDAAGVPLTGIAQVQAGWEFSCALMADKSAPCFGNGQRGERGDGAEGPTHYGSEPVAIVDASHGPAAGILALSLGFHGLCLRDRFSGANCAGENDALHVFGPDVSIPSPIRW